MLEPKHRLGDFEIIRLLGRGGMGEVYEAQQSHPQRRVALKVLAPWLADNEEALERFWREANVPAQLDHPGVVRIYATFKSAELAYYTMQLVRGVSLAELIRTGNVPVPETIDQPPADTSRSDSGSHADGGEPATETMASNDAPPAVVSAFRFDRFHTLARIGMDAAKALAAAHRQGYLHRDIKPSNIMIDHHNQLYLVDFGLTKALDSNVGTRSGVVIGTPWYMSPEQALGHPLDGRSDIYSLGITLYQLATGGKGPYNVRRDDTDAVLREVRSGTRQSLDSLAPNIPAPLQRIIARAIEPKIDQRYQSADALAKDLADFLETSSIRRLATPPPVSLFRRKATWLTGAAALLIGVTLFLIHWFDQRRRQEENPPDGHDIAAFAALLPHKLPDGVPAEVKPIEVKPAAVKPIEVAPADPFHRERLQGVKLNLLRLDHQPVAHRVLVGEGAINPLPTEMVVQAKGDKPLFLALDDPKNGSYDLSLELRPAFQVPPDVNDLGIFFGWRDKLADPKSFMRFFAVKLDTRPALKDIQGRLYIGTWQFTEPRGLIQVAWEDHPRWLHKGRGWIPLGAPAPNADGWRKLHLSVRGDKFSVKVDNEPTQSFDLGWVLQADPWLGLNTWDLDCHGIVGVWVRKGVGHFRDIVLIPK